MIVGVIVLVWIIRAASRRMCEGYYPTPQPTNTGGETESTPTGPIIPYPDRLESKDLGTEETDTTWLEHVVKRLFQPIPAHQQVPVEGDGINPQSDEVRIGHYSNAVRTAQISYEYDALNRLTEANYSDGSSYLYTYDPVGNRLSQQVNGETPTNYLYNAGDRLTSVNGVPYLWDDNGNLLSDGVSAFTYNAANQLVGVTQGQNSASYQYDGLGNRYQQAVNGQVTTYTLDLAGGLSQVLFDGNSAYFYGLERIARQVNGGDYDLFLPDALGSVRQVADGAGLITTAQSFDPFGSPLGQASMGGGYCYAG